MQEVKDIWTWTFIFDTARNFGAIYLWTSSPTILEKENGLLDSHSIPSFLEIWEQFEESSGMWRCVDLVWTDVSEERIACIFRDMPLWHISLRIHRFHFIVLSHDTKIHRVSRNLLPIRLQISGYLDQHEDKNADRSIFFVENASWATISYSKRTQIHGDRTLMAYMLFSSPSRTSIIVYNFALSPFFKLKNSFECSHKI
jgi:hypothetical protein